MITATNKKVLCRWKIKQQTKMTAKKKKIKKKKKNVSQFYDKKKNSRHPLSD